MPQLKSVVLALALALLSAAGAQAQIRSEPPLVERDGELVLEALQQRFALPLPDWLDEAQRQSGEVRAQIEAVYLEDETQALLEIFPKGESQALWTTLYGARITRQTNVALADYRLGVMSAYARNCKPEVTGFFQFGVDEGDSLAPLGFVCGAYLDTLSGYRGLGEVMIVSFRKSEKGIGIIYQEWRGKSFDPAQPATWPVATATVEARAGQLHEGARLSALD
ncbi:MAG: hypothetical protein KIS86_14645 [Devosia sp.]|nr:hypothetical protein [Devosia sp.]